MKCRKCGTELRDDALFCHECGQPKDGPIKCSKCGAELKDDQNYCPFCGTIVLSLQEINEELKKDDIEKLVEEDSFEVETINKEILEECELKPEPTDLTSILFKEKNKIITIVLLIVQMFLFESELLQTKASIMGVSTSAGMKVSEILQYPSWLLYCTNIVSILILCYWIYKRRIYSGIIRYLPAILGWTYPVVLGITYLKFMNDNSLASSVASAGSKLMSSLGGSLDVSLTFNGFILIVSILVIEILTNIEAKKQ